MPLVATTSERAFDRWPTVSIFIETCPLVRLCQFGRLLSGARHGMWAPVMQTTLIKELGLLHRPQLNFGGEWVSLNFEHKIVACRPELLYA